MDGAWVKVRLAVEGITSATYTSQGLSSNALPQVVRPNTGNGYHCLF